MSALKSWPAGFRTKLVTTVTGLALPLAMAAFAIPKLVLGLGESVFGLFALVMALLGYSSILDLGLGRAATKMIAECAVPPLRNPAPYIRAAVYVAVVFSSCVALGVVAVALLGGERLAIHGLAADRVSRALLYAAPGVVFVTLFGITRGVLEGIGEFSTVAGLRLLGGITAFLVPVYCVHAGWGLSGCVASVVLGRGMMLGFGVWRCAHCVRREGESVAWRVALTRLWSFGGWMTVSNLVTPLMTYMDRFLLGAMLSTAAVAVYVTPYDMMVQMIILPSALTSVLFPHMSQLMASGSAALLPVYRKSLLGVFALMAVLVLGVAIPAPALIGWWVSPEFAERAAPVARILAFGVLCNSLTQIPLSLLHAAHMARKTAYLHLAEFLPYLLSLVVLVKMFGVTGAAAAWSLRSFVDLCLMLISARPVLKALRARAPEGVHG
ncbi:MAG: flippase [Uliginosibacterium sp.]|nr:flippase [Uliginosibacterium sp.]